ncbi:DUF2523 domain-containing protein [Hydrogenophaga sp. ANAO-22]|uniref:DUF2523 domain-containing protein n=1 Tax=Hydrogenophaga sp. ANAO-22 TaxID=3166645 RepID=UPI0036D3EF98
MALPLAAGLAGWIVAGLASGVGQIVAKTLVTLGIGYVSYTGLDALITLNEAQILTLIQTLPPTAVQLLGVLKVGTCIRIVFSALMMRATLFGLNEGVIKRMQVT